MADNHTCRRFQFSLQTLLIGVGLLGLPCAYVAHEAKIVRGRQSMRAQIESAGGWVDTAKWSIANPIWVRLGHAEPSDVPWVRRWLGDEAMDYLCVPSSMQHGDVEEIRAAFPES